MGPARGGPMGPQLCEGGKSFSRQRTFLLEEIIMEPHGGAHGPLLGKVGGPMGPESPHGAPGGPPGAVPPPPRGHYLCWDKIVYMFIIESLYKNLQF